MGDPKFLRKMARSAEEVRSTLAGDWFELVRLVGAGAVEDKLGDVHSDTLGNALAGKHAPRLHTALNSLLADPSALFNTLQLYGGVFVPTKPEAVDDMAVILGMMQAATEYLERMKDNHRCHVDTAALAKLFRPLVPQMLAIIREANGDGKTELKAVA